jgi:hypothetical protein
MVDLESNQALDLESLRCHFSVQGSAYNAYATQLPNDPSLQLPLEAFWVRTNGTMTLYTLGSDMGIRVAKGREFRVINSYTGTNSNGLCTAVGVKLTYPN